MKRKNFILMASAGVAAIAVPTIYFKIGASNRKNLELPLQLIHIWDVEMVKTIGLQYLAQFPSENNIETLIDLLLQVGVKNIGAKVKDDFLTDNIVVIDGWILSKTEARQCALFSLVPKTS